MLNAHYPSIDRYRDVESLNYYQILLNQGKSEKEALEILSARSRDNSRTPMQWNDEKYCGFSTAEPWLPVSDAFKKGITVSAQKDDEDSILAFYKKLISLRKEYPVIAKDYFYNKKHQTVEIIKLNGSIELAPIVGLSEVICDIVETGSTLRENGLVVLEEVCPLSARMVVNQVSMKMENERITKLIADLKREIERKDLA